MIIKEDFTLLYFYFQMSGKPFIPHCLGATGHNKYLAGSVQLLAGCIGAHLAWEKVKSEDHA